jgi:Tol biopolymer transport system component
VFLSSMHRFWRWRAAASALCAGCLALALSAPSAVATFPGANGRIAYIDRHGDIHTVLPSGNGDKDTGSLGDGMAWPPLGTRLAFTGQNDCGNPDIYTMRSDGGDVRRLTFQGDNCPYYGGAWDPSYSPGGGRIAFENTFYNSPYYISTMRTDGSHRQDIANNESLAGVDSIYNPVWSPAGEIAFTARRSADHRSSIWAMRSNGTRKHRLVDLGRFRPDPTGGYGPMYSPGGNRFLFVRMHRDGSVRTLLANADGSNVRPAPCTALSTATMVPQRSGVFPISYSPDRRWILALNDLSSSRANLIRISIRSCKRKRIVGGVVGSADWQPLP